MWPRSNKMIILTNNTSLSRLRNKCKIGNRDNNGYKKSFKSPHMILSLPEYHRVTRTIDRIISHYMLWKQVQSVNERSSILDIDPRSQKPNVRDMEFTLSSKQLWLAEVTAFYLLVWFLFYVTKRLPDTGPLSIFIGIIHAIFAYKNFYYNR